MSNEIVYRLMAAIFVVMTFCRSFVRCVGVKEIVRSFGALRQTRCKNRGRLFFKSGKN